MHKVPLKVQLRKLENILCSDQVKVKVEEMTSNVANNKMKYLSFQADQKWKVEFDKNMNNQYIFITLMLSEFQIIALYVIHKGCMEKKLTGYFHSYFELHPT